MKKFNYYMPTRIIEGENCIAQNPALLALGKKALIVTGGSGARKSGALGDAEAALDSAGIGHAVFDGVKENPAVSLCEAGGKAARDAGADFVIGIGGGSALDASKAVAAYAANPDVHGTEIYTASLAPSLPLIAVPTTSGTGSEVNPYAVLTIDAENRKKTFNSPCSYPKTAFLDPRYTASLGENYTLSTALDAFCHCIESYLSPKSTEQSSLFALYGGKLLWEILRDWESRENEEIFVPEEEAADDRRGDAAGLTGTARALLMRAAAAGGLAINTTGTGFPHPLGYSITLEKGTPHGRACGVFTGDFIRYNQKCEEGAERLESFAAYCGTVPGKIASVIPALADVHFDLDEEEIVRCVDKVKGAGNYANSQYVISDEEKLAIYRAHFLK